jgi:hypothetical protein
MKIHRRAGDVNPLICLFRGSSLGTHCLEAPASCIGPRRQEPPVHCVPGLEPRNEDNKMEDRRTDVLPLAFFSLEQDHEL